MNVGRQPVEFEEINRVIEKILPMLGDEEEITVRAALLSMVVMNTFPHLQGDALISAVENAAQLLMTLDVVQPHAH